MATPTSAGLPKANVLYSVYRPLIKLAPSEELKDHVRQAFRRSTKLTQPAKIARRVGEAKEVSTRALGVVERANLGHSG